MKKIALIGLGPHARRIYYPYFENRRGTKKDVELTLVVDLDINRNTIERYLGEQKLKPKKIVYLNSKEQITPAAADGGVAKLFLELGITHAIIATEPKAHKAYLKLCIEHGIPVLVDKPITAPVNLMPTNESVAVTNMYDPALAIKEDVLELHELIRQHPASRVLVQCQRRQHEGYELIRKMLDEAIKTYNVPITYLNIHHSDGMWNMPGELHSRENHPYKYGYGKLMHSGYHFIDLMYTFLRLNLQLESKRPDAVSIFNQTLRPLDHYESINGDDYRQLLGEGQYGLPDNPLNASRDSYGELDSYSQLQLLKAGKVLTTAQLSLMQSGFSQRAWPMLPKDTYKGNGRIRHESVNIHVGPLYNIQVHSYQAAQVKEDYAASKTVGGKDHFDIYIFKNSNLLGGQPFELIQFGREHAERHKADEHYLGHNEQPRHQAIDELLDGLPSNSELESHLTTNALMSAFYANHARQQFNRVPYKKYKLEEIFYDTPSVQSKRQHRHQVPGYVPAH